MKFDKDCLVIVILGITVIVAFFFHERTIAAACVGAMATFLTRKPGCDSLE